MKSYIDFCKENKINLFQVEHYNGLNYKNRSTATFWVKKPTIITNDTSIGNIYLGIYDNDEWKEISFYHELGHCLIDYPINIFDISEYNLEKMVWRKGLEIAKNNNKIFSIGSLRWAVRQLHTYSKDVLCKNSTKIRLNLNENTLK
jgi:hypothetical protein